MNGKVGGVRNLEERLWPDKDKCRGREGGDEVMWSKGRLDKVRERRLSAFRGGGGPTSSHAEVDRPESERERKSQQEASRRAICTSVASSLDRWTAKDEGSSSFCSGNDAKPALSTERTLALSFARDFFLLLRVGWTALPGLFPNVFCSDRTGRAVM